MMTYAHMSMIFYMLLKIWFTKHSFHLKIQCCGYLKLIDVPRGGFLEVTNRPTNLLAQVGFITADSILAWIQLKIICNK